MGEMYAAGSSANKHGDYDFFAFRCSGNSIPVPSPFAGSATAGTANNQGVSLTWSNATLPGAIFQIERENSTGAPGTWTIIKDYSANYTATSLSDTGLLPNNLYCYRIEAKMDDVPSPIKLQACVTTTVNPPSLTSPLTVVSTSQINVSWPNVTGNIAYKLERSTGGAYSQIGGGDLAQDTIGYNDTGLTTGTIYYYRLSVRNRSGYSLTSTALNATTVPAVPTGLNAYSPSNNTIYVSWTNMAGNTGYTLQRLQRDTDPTQESDWSGAASIDNATNDVTVTDSGLLAGKRYYYRVRTKGSGPDSGSAYSGFVYKTTVLIAPSGAAAASKSGSTSVITVTWTDTNTSPGTGSNETSYVIERSPCKTTKDSPATCGTADANYDAYATAATSPTPVPADALTADVTGLEAGHTYRFRMYSALSGANSAYTAVFYETVNLPAPGGLSVVAGSLTSTTVNITWNNVLGESRFYVEQCLVSSCTWGNATVTAGNPTAQNITTAAVTGLTQNTAYKFRIKADNSNQSPASDPSYSAELPVTTLANPPALYTVTAMSTASAALSWEKIGAATNYKIEWDTSSGGAFATNTIKTIAQTNCDGATNCTYTVTSGDGASFTAGVVYYFRVRYTADGSVYSGPSSQQNDTMWPPVPSAFRAESAALDTTTSVYLSWNDVLGETKYVVQQTGPLASTSDDCPAVGDGSWANANNPTVMPLNGGVQTYSPAGLQAGRKYCFRLMAYNDALDTDSSRYNTALGLVTKLTAPTGLTLYNMSATEIDLSWNAVANANGYQIDRKIGAGTYSALVANNAGTTYPNTGLSAGTAYCYQIRTRNASGLPGPATTEVCKTTTPGAPSFHAQTKALSTTQIQVSWNAASGASGYCVQFKQKQNQGTSDCSGEADWPADATCDDQAAQVRTYTAMEGTRYCMRVRSYVDNPKRYSAYNTPTQKAALLSAVTDLTGLTTSTTTIVLSWTNKTAGAGNNGYRIERKTGTGGTYATLTSPAKDIITYSDSTGSAGTQYCYRIYAKNADNGESAVSNEVCKTTTPAAPPATLRMDVISPSEIDLSWQVVYGATHYRLERRLSSEPDTSFAQVGSNLAVGYGTSYCGYYGYQPVGCSLIANFTSYQDTTVAGDTQYCYRVKAWNSDGGYSAESNTACGKTSSVNAPAITSVTALSSRQLQLSWTYTPLGGETLDGFEIESKTDSSDWANLATVDNATFSYADSKGIQPSKKYYYRVRALRTILTSDFSSGIDPAVWSQTGVLQGVSDTTDSTVPISVSNSTGSTAITETGGAVRMTSVANLTGTVDKYNYSKLSLVTPSALGGDFEIQVDYNIVGGQITPAQVLKEIYSRIGVVFPTSVGGANEMQITRLVANSIDLYRCATAVDSGSWYSNDLILTMTENSGKLKIARNGNSLLAYVWYGNTWYLLKGVSNVSLSGAPTSVYFNQWSQQTGNKTITTDFDNFKVIEKSPFSASGSATTPAWLEGDDTCN